MNLVSLLFNTCFFVGKIPFAPGTMGSIFSLAIWWLFIPSIKLMIILLILNMLFNKESSITILWEKGT